MSRPQHIFERTSEFDHKGVSFRCEVCGSVIEILGANVDTRLQEIIEKSRCHGSPEKHEKAMAKKAATQQKKPTRQPPQEYTPQKPLSTCLAGTELKLLLKKFNFTITPGCKCTARAQRMDLRGCNWCEKNIELIIDWLEEEAEIRGFPFVRTAGKILTKQAIRSARKKERKLIDVKS